MKNFLLLLILMTAMMSCQQKQAAVQAGSFPFFMPEEKPDRPLSAAVARNYDAYLSIRPEQNELYTQFKYTALKGFDYNGGNGTLTRRDPSKVIFENGKYYVWYTYRNTPVKPVGLSRAKEANDTIPSSDWDLADIWYATSEDGFTWEEQGVAISRPPKPQPGWRSVTTTDILKWEGKYYLYYQAFMEVSGLKGDNCPVAVSYADAPDGPWTPTHDIVIPNGAAGEWDQFKIHDPYPLVHDGKIYIYDKSGFDERPDFFIPDAFTDTKDGRGISWGLSHFINAGGDWSRNHTILTRFDCDLSQDIHDDQMKGHYLKHSPEFHYQQGLNKEQLERIEQENRKQRSKPRGKR